MADCLYCIFIILFIVSYYDINHIIETFVRFWITDTNITYVHLTKIMVFFKPDYCGFLELFFKNDRVEFDDFFLFICAFLFFDNDMIISLLLSMIGIHSNIFITALQIDEFCKKVYLNDLYNIIVDDLLPTDFAEYNYIYI